MPPRRPLSLYLAGLWVLLLLAAGSLGAPFARPDNLRFIREFERRSPTPWPQVLSWRDTFRTDLYARLSTVLAESLPLRSWMIFFRNVAERDLFGRTRFGDVDLGRDGWLFTRAAYHRPEETPAQVDRTLAAFAAYCDAPPARTDLQWVIIPEKSVIYPEYLAASARWYADAFFWRHVRLRAFCERRGPAGHCRPLWQAFLAAKARARSPLYFRTDSHYTPRTSLLAMRAVVDACAPGLWREEDVRSPGTKPRYGDLSIFVAGQLGSRPEPEEKWEVRRPEVELVEGEWVRSGRRLAGNRPEAFWRIGTDLYGSRSDWQQACRLLSRSRGARLVAGRTLILYDSALAQARESLRQFFTDVTFCHYDDLIAADDLAERLAVYDRVVVEIGERLAIEKLEALLRPVRTRVVRQFDGTSLGLLSGNGEVRLRAEGRDLVAEATGSDPILFLPSLPAPAPGSYELRAELESPAENTAQLFFRGRADTVFGEARSRYRKLAPGRNVVYFPLTAEQAGQPLRFDPGILAGQYRIHSLQIRRWLDAPSPAGTTSAELPALWLYHGVPGALPVVAWGTLSAGPDVRLTPSASGVEIVSAAGGAVQLPLLTPTPKAAPTLELELDAEHGAPGGLIATGESDPALCWRLRSGRNRIRLQAGRALFEQPLWFQPGQTPGTYRLRRLAVTGVQPPDGTAPPAVGPSASWTATLVPAPGLRTGTRCETLARGARQVVVRTGPEGLVVQATGEDPQLLFPPLNLPGRGLRLIRIDLETPCPTYTQVFFVKAGMKGFTEDLSQGRALPAGRQELWFVVPAEYLRQEWRFDPGCHPGTYALRRVEVIPFELTP